jgi:hypothetical protein
MRYVPAAIGRSVGASGITTGAEAAVLGLIVEPPDDGLLQADAIKAATTRRRNGRNEGAGSAILIRRVIPSSTVTELIDIPHNNDALRVSSYVSPQRQTPVDLSHVFDTGGQHHHDLLS